MHRQKPVAPGRALSEPAHTAYAAPTKRDSAEEEFARRAYAAPLVRLRKGTLNPQPQPAGRLRADASPGAANPMKIQHSAPLGPSKPMEIQHAALLRLSKRSGTILQETHRILRAPRMRPAPRPGPANHTKIRHSAFVGPANLMSIQNAALLGLSKRSGAIPPEIRTLLRAPSMRPALHVKHTYKHARAMRGGARPAPSRSPSRRSKSLGFRSVPERFLRKSGTSRARQARGLRHA